MSLQDFTDYSLPRNAYLSFDANSLKTLIIDRLNENETFTDQNFEGSNFSAFIDVVAYMYHVLLFQLNTTSNESTFSTATIYENMNKLVSTIGYNPLGDQTSLVNISLSARNLTSNVYTLPRFSSIAANGNSYVTIEDITFEKTIDNTLEQVAPSNSTLYQGTITETSYNATGEPYENIILIDSFTSKQLIQSTSNVRDSKFISDNSFNIFVQNNTSGEWSQYEETSSLFLESADAKKYEKRLNGRGNYEFKFGNNLNGKQLEANDTVLIFYVISDNEAGIVGPNSFTGTSFTLFGSTNFDAVKNIIYDTNQTLITAAQLGDLLFNNRFASSPTKIAETVADIRRNAPKVFAAQNRLVTKDDYEYQLNRNFNNITRNVKILSNNDYTSKVLSYYDDIGLARGNDDTRILFSQVLFSASTSFNNVYVYTVPSSNPTLNGRTPNYLNSAQKQLLAEFCDNKKDVTQNVVISDPIFKAFAFGAPNVNDDSVDDTVNNSQLQVTLDKNKALNDSSIKSSIYNIINNYFNGVQLGDLIDVSRLTTDILNIPGVTGLNTINGDSIVPNLNFVIWNPDYKNEDNVLQSLNYQLEDFQFAYFYNPQNIMNKIAIRRL
jgi:DNA-dependent RNA polymerase auxiliary subunit epsilon